MNIKNEIFQLGDFGTYEPLRSQSQQNFEEFRNEHIDRKKRHSVKKDHHYPREFTNELRKQPTSNSWKR